MLTDTAPEQVVETPQSYLSVLKISVPSSTKWDPAIAEQLMIGLFSVGRPMNLEIGVTKGKIEWAVVVPFDYQESTINYIYSFYPNAIITAEFSVEFVQSHFKRIIIRKPSFQRHIKFGSSCAHNH